MLHDTTLYALTDNPWMVASLVLALIVTVMMVKTYRRITFMPKSVPRDMPTRSLSADDGKGLVAYVFAGNERCMTFSPYSTKLLTYLRLAHIPHRVQYAEYDKAPKNKVPYVLHNGNLVGDTQLIIRYLENTLDVAKIADKGASGKRTLVPFAGLTSEQQALSDVVRLTCEGELYWALVSMRWYGAAGLARDEGLWQTTSAMFFAGIPSLLRPLIVKIIRATSFRDAWGHGFARHSPGDQWYLASRAVRALSALLGDKDYFLGDIICEGDCAVFGLLQCLLEDTTWPNEFTAFIRKECPNLVRFVERIQALAFADTTRGQKMPASVDSSGTLLYK